MRFKGFIQRVYISFTEDQFNFEKFDSTMRTYFRFILIH